MNRRGDHLWKEVFIVGIGWCLGVGQSEITKSPRTAQFCGSEIQDRNLPPQPSAEFGLERRNPKVRSVTMEAHTLGNATGDAGQGPQRARVVDTAHADQVEHEGL